MKISGIIVRIAQYKDNDAMVTILSNDKLLSFYVRGIYKLDNKNAILNSPLSYGEFTFIDNKNNYSYKEYSPIIDTRLFINDFAKLVAINFVNEVTLKLFSEEDMVVIYPYLLEVISSLKKDNINIPLLLLSYLCTSLKLTGFALEVDKCVILGVKEDIVGISYVDGGFVSRNAYNPKIHMQYSPKQCLLVRALYKNKYIKLNQMDINKDDIKKIFKDMLMYTYDQLSIHFISENLVMKLL